MDNYCENCIRGYPPVITRHLTSCVGWCPYDGEECHHDGYCKECDVYLNKKGCDRCGKPIKKYVPLNAIPMGRKRSLSFELRVPDEFTMKTAELCIDCVQSFFDWWKEGDHE